MKRRDFLKAMALAGATAVIDLTGAGKLLAQSQTKAKSSGIDMVAILGGEPAAMLNRMIAEFGGISKFVKKGQKVVIKPNIGWDKTPQMAANTNPLLVGALVKQCVKGGASEVLVFDHTCNNWQNCYKNSGIKAEVERNGGKMIPGNDESSYVDVTLPKAKRLKNAKIHKALIDCDVWFNVPVLKSHGGAKMTIALKNYMGIVWDRPIFHDVDLQQCIADIATWHKKPALNIVDAYRVMLTGGPQGRNEDDVKLMKGLFASADPVAVDAACVKFFAQAKGMTINDASHILQAERLNVGTTNVDQLNIKRIKL